MRGEKRKNAAILLMKHLNGRAFDLFYDAFAKNEHFKENGKNYEKVNKVLLNNFGKRDRLKEKVTRNL